MGVWKSTITQHYKKAQILLNKASQVLRPYAQHSPHLFGNKQAYILLFLIQSNEQLENHQDICSLSQAVLKISQNKEDKKDKEVAKQIRQDFQCKNSSKN